MLTKAVLSLPSDTEILVVREFAAPRERVWRAWTEPELIRRWWHANRGEVTDVTGEARAGGTWRRAMITPDGTEVAFRGEYLEVDPPARLVTSEVFEPHPDSPAHVTATFAETETGTRLELTMRYPSMAVRDMVLATGMEDGLQDALDLADEVALSLS